MSAAPIPATATRLRAAGIIAIVRGNFIPDRLDRIAESLVTGGVTALEVTLNSQGALGAISRIRERLGPDVLVGAGTVRTADDVDAAIDAGASFVVSPNLDVAAVARSRARGVVHLPGVFTATEAQAAHAARCGLVKLFPADALGPAYLRALRAPLDDIGFVPTGGIDETTIGEYVRAGAVAFGVGSALVRGDEASDAGLEGRARRLVAALGNARERLAV